jgi:hypothetical protein
MPLRHNRVCHYVRDVGFLTTSAGMSNVWRAMLPGLALGLLVSGCGKGDKRDAAPGRDPIENQALNDPIMSDPDLNSQNRANDGLAVRDAGAQSVPDIDRSAEAIAGAKAEALTQADGAIRSAPTPERGRATALADAVTAGQFAAAIGGPGSDCPGRIAYSAIWAARLSAPFAVYPRGHVQEAAGTDANGCRLRAVNYISAVEQDDIVDWYYTRLAAAGFGASHRLEGDDHVLRGGKGAAAYVILVRRREDGLSEVSLAVNGA